MLLEKEELLGVITVAEAPRAAIKMSANIVICKANMYVKAIK
jgi:hypothetical protein